MTDPIQKAIEALEFYAKPDNWCLNTIGGDDCLFEQRAGATAQEALTALRAVAETHVLVPREPTGEMWSAGRKEFARFVTRIERVVRTEEAEVHTDCAPAEMYKAMIEAAQKGGE